jgi:hypothetical protein
MRHIIYNLFAVALLLALPIAINAQTTKNDTTTIPKWAKTFPASLTLEDIKKLCWHEVPVEEIKADGSVVKLTLENYDK